MPGQDQAANQSVSAVLFGTVVFTMGEVTADDPWLAEVTIGHSAGADRQQGQARHAARGSRSENPLAAGNFRVPAAQPHGGWRVPACAAVVAGVRKARPGVAPPDCVSPRPGIRTPGSLFKRRDL